MKSQSVLSRHGFVQDKLFKDGRQNLGLVYGRRRRGVSCIEQRSGVHHESAFSSGKKEIDSQTFFRRS